MPPEIEASAQAATASVGRKSRRDSLSSSDTSGSSGSSDSDSDTDTTSGATSSTSSSSDSEVSSASRSSAESLDILDDKDMFHLYVRGVENALKGRRFFYAPEGVEAAPGVGREKVLQRFEEARKRIEDRVTIRRDLLCDRVAWRAGFPALLQRYSHVEVARRLNANDPAEREMKCMACGKNGSVVLHLSGVRYDAHALWTAGSDVAHSVIRHVRRLKPTSIANSKDGVLVVGPGCKEAALWYHGLHHYKYRLIHSVAKHMRSPAGLQYADCKALYHSMMMMMHKVEERFLEGSSLTEPGQLTLDRWMRRKHPSKRRLTAADAPSGKRFRMRDSVSGEAKQVDIRTMMAGQRPLLNSYTPPKPTRAPKPARQTTLAAFKKLPAGRVRH
eukprot:Rhum_TRINITY_DN14467_c31_g1::Rhum_TRINITY_DN14467_c31_g1_i1::g.91847::m.91847